MSDLWVGTIISILTGGLGILLGYLIKKKELAYWIAGYNANKHDPKVMCNVVGSNIILLGILISFYAIIHHIGYEYFMDNNIYVILSVITVLAILLKIKYDLKNSTSHK